MIVAAIGSTCLGFIVGWLVRYFLFRFKEFNAQILGSTVSLIAGSTVTVFFNLFDPGKSVIWFYPIGLLAGFLVYSITAKLFGAPSQGSIYYVSREDDESKQ